MKRVDVVSALINDEKGNLLIVKNINGDSYYWGLPGGAAILFRIKYIKGGKAN